MDKEIVLYAYNTARQEKVLLIYKTWMDIKSLTLSETSKAQKSV